MKKILTVSAVVTLLGATACNNDSTVSSDLPKENSQAQKNLEAHRTVAKAFETGNVAGLDSVVASDFVDHSERGDVKGVDSLKAMVNMVHTNFKDMKVKTEKELADDDYVMAWMHYSGTGDGKMMPPGPYDMDVIETTKFRDGKAVEHWTFTEMADVMKMMQSMPMGNMNRMDTTKKK